MQPTTTGQEEAPIRIKDLSSQIFTSISVSIVSMLVGFTNAYTAPAAESMKKDMDLSTTDFSRISGIMPLIAILGALLGGPSIQLIGRKWSLLASDIIFLLSFAIMALAGHIWMLYTSRVIAGFAVGMANLVLPVYLGETILAKVRGTLGLFPTLIGNGGMLTCYTAGRFLQWKPLAWVGLAICVPFLFLVFVLPESPVWYINKGKDDSSKSALRWLRSKSYDIEPEFDEIKKSTQEHSKRTLNIKDFFTKSNMKPLLIALGLMFFQQLSGINAVVFFTTTIFEMAGSTIDSSLCTIIVGIVNLIATLIATALVDRLGRKVLLYISATLMAITLVGLGVYFFFKGDSSDFSGAKVGWLPLLCLVVYVLGFSMGYGPIPWLMMGEILPEKVRGLDASVVTSFNWFGAFAVTRSFLVMVDNIGPSYTFWIYAAIVLVSFVFVFFFVPETKGRTLQEIEKNMSGNKPD